MLVQKKNVWVECDAILTWRMSQTAFLLTFFVPFLLQLIFLTYEIFYDLMKFERSIYCGSKIPTEMIETHEYFQFRKKKW